MGWRYSILRLLARELLGRFERAFADPERAQRERLAVILGLGAQTAYGRSVGLGGLADPDAYRRRVPLVTYEDLAPWMERVAAGDAAVLSPGRVPLLLKTSGTTGAAKLIPCTPGLERETGEARAWWVTELVREDEGVAAGSHLTVYSPEVEGYTAGGVPYGSNTGRIHNRQASVFKLAAPVPPEVFALGEAQTRYELLLLFALAAEDLVTLTTANPSTLLLLLRILRERGPALLEELAAGRVAPRPGLDPGLQRALGQRLAGAGRRAARLQAGLRRDGALLPRSIWPRLRSVNTWRCGGAAFYEPRLREAFPGVALRDPGFSASEGFVAMPDRADDPSGVLNVAGHFFEFLPADAPPGGGGQATRLAHELRLGDELRPVLSTSGGLFRYDLGDVARVEGFRNRAPRLRFLRRAGRVLSVTGEKVSEQHVERAAAVACAALGLRAVDFCVGLRLGETPRYWFAVELEGGARAPAALGPAFDAALADANVEYSSKRASLRLDPPELLSLAAGAFGRERARLLAAGAPDAQLKLPHLALDPDLLGRLLG